MAFPVTNLLLEALPSAEKARLLAQCSPIPLPVNTVIFEAEQTPRYMYLLTSGIASVVMDMAGGDAVEVGVIGREGLPGSAFLLGNQVGLTHSFMQVSGAGFRMDFARFQEEFLHNANVRGRVLQFVQAESLTLAQLSACNRLHELEERLARWLLMVQDRTGEPTLPLTQEFLAGMLGARRSTVNLIAGTLQRAGLIEHRRGRVHILDREGLESAACECYPFVRQLQQNLYMDGLR